MNAGGDEWMVEEMNDLRMTHPLWLFQWIDWRTIHLSYKIDIEQALVAKLGCSENDIPPAKRNLSAFNHLNDVKFDDANVEVGINYHST